VLTDPLLLLLLLVVVSLRQARGTLHWLHAATAARPVGGAGCSYCSRRGLWRRWRQHHRSISTTCCRGVWHALLCSAILFRGPLPLPLSQLMLLLALPL